MGFVDKFGEIVISIKYEFAGPFYYGLARVRLNGKYGFINKLGEEVFNTQKSHIEVAHVG